MLLSLILCSSSLLIVGFLAGDGPCIVGTEYTLKLEGLSQAVLVRACWSLIGV